MNYILSFIVAMLVASVVPVNGALSDGLGPYLSTVIVHIVGLIPSTVIAVVHREKLFALKGLRPSAFLGGVIGVSTVVTRNIAYAADISVSAVVALSLFGQTVASLLIDQFGLIGMQVKRFDKAKLIGLVCTALGIGVMLYGAKASFLPVVLSFSTGVTIVLSRTFNARLANERTLFVSTWYNFAVGLAVSLIVWLISIPLGASPAPKWSGLPVWAFFGGLIGIFTVNAQSYVTSRMPAFRLTLILFIGQIFTGLLLDVIAGTGGSPEEWIGGAFAVAGLSLNALFDRRKERRCAR